MFAVCVVVTALLAAGALASAAMKLQKKEEIVVSIRDHLGMSLTVLPKLAALEIAGAIGSLVGLAVPALGVAACSGLVLYFLGAVGAHVRAGDTKNASRPAPFLLLAGAALVLLLATM